MKKKTHKKLLYISLIVLALFIVTLLYTYRMLQMEAYPIGGDKVLKGTFNNQMDSSSIIIQFSPDGTVKFDGLRCSKVTFQPNSGNFNGYPGFYFITDNSTCLIHGGAYVSKKDAFSGQNSDSEIFACFASTINFSQYYIANSTNSPGNLYLSLEYTDQYKSAVICNPNDELTTSYSINIILKKDFELTVYELVDNQCINKTVMKSQSFSYYQDLASCQSHIVVPTPTPSPTPTSSASPTPTSSVSPTPTPSVSPSPSPTVSPSPTNSPTPTPTINDDNFIKIFWSKYGVYISIAGVVLSSITSIILLYFRFKRKRK